MPNSMTGMRTIGDAMRSLMEQIRSDDGMIRKKARESLVAIGKPAARSLCKALRSASSDQLRWEAAKALGDIGDKRSIPALVAALGDRDHDVAWLAAEGLAKHGIAAWPPILRALAVAGPDSRIFRRGAHHVFASQELEGFDDLLNALKKDLESNAARESASVDAFALLARVALDRRRGVPFAGVPMGRLDGGTLNGRIGRVHHDAGFDSYCCQ
jgi:HEAT repeat protein